MQDLGEVCEYEAKVGGIILDPSSRDSNHHFSVRNYHNVSPRYYNMFKKKAQLIMRMLEFRLGTELLLQVRGTSTELVIPA